jgi:hypothetical protein
MKKIITFLKRVFGINPKIKEPVITHKEVVKPKQEPKKRKPKPTSLPKVENLKSVDGTVDEVKKPKPKRRYNNKNKTQKQTEIKLSEEKTSPNKNTRK